MLWKDTPNILLIISRAGSSSTPRNQNGLGCFNWVLLLSVLTEIGLKLKCHTIHAVEYTSTSTYTNDFNSMRSADIAV